MGNTTTTAYMNLTLPVPTVEIGPAWAIELITAFNSIDSHDHTNGKGKLIPSSALNINADLNFYSYTAMNLLSTKFVQQTTPLVGLSNVASLYVVNGNLYYTNGSGSSVQVTNGSFLAPAPGTVNSLGILNISNDLTILPSDNYTLIGVDTSAIRTIHLPSIALVTPGRLFAIKDSLGAAFTNPIHIVPNGSDTVNSAAFYNMNSGTGCIWMATDGTSNWNLV